jgi:DNA-binding CsgD family transcriptional regulator
MTAPHEVTALCVHLAALGPRPSVEQYIAPAHARIAAVFGASSGHVVLGVRERRIEDDPLGGWRIPFAYRIGARSREEIVAVGHELAEHTYVHDPVVQRVVADAGRHRVYHDPDPRTDRARAGTLDEKYWALFGLVDRLKLVYSLAPDFELHLSVDRLAGSPRFEERDARLLEHVATGLGPWVRRVALLHGCLAGHVSLSDRERDVACALLGHEPLKVIAAELGVGEARARELVRAVYRKLGVGSRAQLASLWAGGAADLPAQPIASARGRTAAGRRARARRRG